MKLCCVAPGGALISASPVKPNNNPARKRIEINSI
jgi:hypothetical protein